MTESNQRENSLHRRKSSHQEEGILHDQKASPRKDGDKNPSYHLPLDRQMKGGLQHVTWGAQSVRQLFQVFRQIKPFLQSAAVGSHQKAGKKLAGLLLQVPVFVSFLHC